MAGIHGSLRRGTYSRPARSPGATPGNPWSSWGGTSWRRNPCARCPRKSRWPTFGVRRLRNEGPEAVFRVLGKPRPRTTFRPTSSSSLSCPAHSHRAHRGSWLIPQRFEASHIYTYTIFAYTCVGYLEIGNTLKTVRNLRSSPPLPKETRRGRRGVLPARRDVSATAVAHLQGAAAVLDPRLVRLFTLRGNLPR